jgi:hypothetical protein
MRSRGRRAKRDSASRDTTVTKAHTGQTHTFSSGYNGEDRYASARRAELSQRRQRLAEADLKRLAERGERGYLMGG